MPAQRTTSRSKQQQQQQQQQAKIGFAARKGSSSTATGSAKKAVVVQPAAQQQQQQQQQQGVQQRSSPRRKEQQQPKPTTKVEVVELSDEDDEARRASAGEEDEAALEALADLERRPASSANKQPRAVGRARPHPPPPVASSSSIEEDGELEPRDKHWNRPYKEALAALGGNKPIHCESEDRTTTILRVFDNDTRFGPATSISRLARWERAQRWGLNPPLYVKEILTTKQGKADQDLRETVFYARI